MTIISRLDKYMIMNNLNDNQVTVNCGLSVGLLGKARKEGNDLGKKAIEKVLSFYPNLNKSWLLTGEGEMLRDVKTDITNLPEVQTTDTITISKDFYEVLLSQKDTIRILQETAISDRKIIVNLTALLSKRIVAEQDTTTEPAKCADAG